MESIDTKRHPKIRLDSYITELSFEGFTGKIMVSAMSGIEIDRGSVSPLSDCCTKEMSIKEATCVECNNEFFWGGVGLTKRYSKIYSHVDTGPNYEDLYAEEPPLSYNYISEAVGTYPSILGEFEASELVLNSIESLNTDY